ncbi:unnamed protein product, partial [marine sediment metagenome]
RMVEAYCSNMKNPLERVCLKYDLFYPLAKLPEVVEKMVSQSPNASGFCPRHVTKRELIEIEKSCTESLVLSRAILNGFYIPGRIDVELKKVISDRPSIWQRLNPWTRSRLLQAIADDIWQNIFDALLDNPEVRKVRRLLLQNLFMDGKNEKMSKGSEPTHREKSS